MRAMIRTFSFKPVSESQVFKVISSLNSKKATGVDRIPPKILRMGQRHYPVPFPVFLIWIFFRRNFQTGYRLLKSVQLKRMTLLSKRIKGMKVYSQPILRHLKVSLLRLLEDCDLDNHRYEGDPRSNANSCVIVFTIAIFQDSLQCTSEL